MNNNETHLAVAGTLYASSLGEFNILIGLNSGISLPPDSHHIVIIGDDIPDLVMRGKPGIMYIGERMAVGAVLFGRPCTLFQILLETLKDSAKRYDCTDLRTEASVFYTPENPDAPSSNVYTFTKPTTRSKCS